jgi:ABC-type phosphate transport system permease subunit
MIRRMNPRDENIRPSIAGRLFAWLTLLFALSVGVIFGRIYLLSFSPSRMKAWLEPVSFWVVVVLLVAFALAMMRAIYVLATKQRNWISRHSRD